MGILTIDTGLITNTATGILSTNDLTIDDVSFFETGVAIDVVSGSADISGLGLENVSVGIGSDSGASTTVTSIYGQHVLLLIDGTDADDLTVSNALVSGDRLLWGSVESISLSDMNFTQENPGRSAIDLRCSIDCTFDNIYVHNADIGIDVDGTGTTTLTESEIHADQLGLRASGTGLLVMESSLLKANETAFSISSVNTELTDTTISLHDGVGPAAILLEGEHQWDDVEVTKPYSSLDTQSVGLDVWYSTIHATSLTTDGFAYGAEIEDCTLNADDGSFINGKLRGLHAIDSQVSLDSMTTTAQEYGLVLSESSKATIADWTANLHNTPFAPRGRFSCSCSNLYTTQHCSRLKRRSWRWNLPLWRVDNDERLYNRFWLSLRDICLVC